MNGLDRGLCDYIVCADTRSTDHKLYIKICCVLHSLHVSSPAKNFSASIRRYFGLFRN